MSSVGPVGLPPGLPGLMGPQPTEQEAREQFEAWDKAYRNATPQEHLSMGLHAGPGMVLPVPPAGTSIDGRVITQEDIDTYNFTNEMGPNMMGPGIVEPMSMGPPPTYMTETGEAASGPGTGITRIDKPVTRNPLVDPRMYRSYAENVQLMGDPRMRGAKGGLAKILGV